MWQRLGLRRLGRVFQAFPSSLATRCHRSLPLSVGPRDQLSSVGSELALCPHQLDPLLVLLELLPQLG